MKAIQFKKVTTVMALIMSLGFSTIIHAEDIVIPVISKPAALQEGIQRDLTPAQIEELLPWAKDSKVFLNDILESLQNISSADKVDRMIEGIKQVVGESSPKNSELLMRYTLNRALVLNEILSKEMGQEVVGTIDVKIRILTSSIKMAIKNYDSDMNTIQKKASMPFAAYGVEYFIFLYELNKSVFDASAQFNIHRTALEWLQWDLYRDLNNTGYAAAIVKINNNLKLLPVSSTSDAQAISFIRQMKQLTSTMSFSPVRNSNVHNNINVSTNGSSSDLLSTRNFKKCYELKYRSLTSVASMDYCTKEIKKTGFDFTNEQFLSCYSYAYKTKGSSHSVDKCVAEVKDGYFDYNNKSFEKCYELKYRSWSSIDSADFCMATVRETGFDFTEPGFLSCYSLAYASLSSTKAIDKCMEY